MQVAQADPAHVRAVSETAEVPREQVHFWPREGRARGIAIGKSDPANVRTPGLAVEIARAIVVHAKVAGGVVEVTNTIGRRAAAQINPTGVGAIHETGA